MKQISNAFLLVHNFKRPMRSIFQILQQVKLGNKAWNYNMRNPFAPLMNLSILQCKISIVTFNVSWPNKCLLLSYLFCHIFLPFLSKKPNMPLSTQHKRDNQSHIFNLYSVIYLGLVKKESGYFSTVILFN